MRLLKNTSEREELIVKDNVITIARRIYEEGEHSKEYIIDVADLTEDGYEEVIKRATVMECARIFLNQFRIDFLEEKLNLSAGEVKDLIKYKESMKYELGED